MLRPSTSCTASPSATILRGYGTACNALIPDVLALQEVDSEQPRSERTGFTVAAAYGIALLARYSVASCTDHMNPPTKVWP